MIIIAALLAILIGILMGAMGAGGAIIVTPFLVYILNTEPQIAINSAYLFVACLSTFGAVSSIYKKQINWQAILYFGLPSMLFIFIARYIIVPFIPITIYKSAYITISKGSFLMILFGILLMAISWIALKNRSIKITPTTNDIVNYFITGALVGMLTATFGVGGGFLLIPALTIVLGLSINEAIGTSLLLISINSLSSFILIDHSKNLIQSDLLLTLIVFSIIGLFVGLRIRSKVSAIQLKKWFYTFTLILSVFILSFEVINILNCC